jgi:hypothetical protein
MHWHFDNPLNRIVGRVHENRDEKIEVSPEVALDNILRRLDETHTSVPMSATQVEGELATKKRDDVDDQGYIVLTGGKNWGMEYSANAGYLPNAVMSHADIIKLCGLPPKTSITELRNILQAYPTSRERVNLFTILVGPNNPQEKSAGLLLMLAYEPNDSVPLKPLSATFAIPKRTDELRLVAKLRNGAGDRSDDPNKQS